MKLMIPSSLTIIISLFLFIVSCEKDNENPPPVTPTNCCTDTIQFQLANWDYFSETDEQFHPTTGNVTQTAEGFKFFGTSFRHGSRISTKSPFCLKNKTIKTKWKVNGGSTVNSFAVALYYDKNAPSTDKVNMLDLNFFVVNATIPGATVIQNDTWYYTRVKFSETSALSVTSTTNYDDAGGAIIHSATYQVKLPAGFPAIYSGDTFGGTSTYMVVAEYRLLCNNN